ncbi:hypothetical protein J6590_033611 [Homalodisca vitripennis]|nr:hypothetical protein J6590_033611 [Homalodisca vitripennis]
MDLCELQKAKKGSAPQINEVDLTSNPDDDFEPRYTEDNSSQEQSSKELISTLCCEFANLDQYGIRLNRDILGLKLAGDLKEGNLVAVIQNVAKDNGVAYTSIDIHQAHHLQQRRHGKPPTAIV